MKSDDELCDELEQKIVFGPLIDEVRTLLARHLQSLAYVFEGNLQRPDHRAQFLLELNKLLSRKEMLRHGLFRSAEATFEKGASLYDRSPPVTLKATIETHFHGRVVLNYTMKSL